EIDLAHLESASLDIARTLRRGSLVSFETTVPVGTTRQVLAPLLERGGRKAGLDFDLVFSPERVKSRSVLRQLTANPKIVGGITPASADRGCDFYRTYLGTEAVNVGSLEA